MEQGAESKKREKQADDAAIKDKQKKKAEVKEKQKQAEKLISEASDHLAKAASSNSKSELVAAQALLQSGNTKLKEARKEEEELDAAALPKKKCNWTDLHSIECLLTWILPLDLYKLYL